jgi:hypothetical protein
MAQASLFACKEHIASEVGQMDPHHKTYTVSISSDDLAAHCQKIRTCWDALIMQRSRSTCNSVSFKVDQKWVCKGGLQKVAHLLGSTRASSSPYPWIPYKRHLLQPKSRCGGTDCDGACQLEATVRTEVHSKLALCDCVSVCHSCHCVFLAGAVQA